MKKSAWIVILLLCVQQLTACPMCQGEISEKTITAYKLVTLFLTLLPFLLGGSIFWWYKRRSGEERREFKF